MKATAKRIVSKLVANGHDALFVGGAVRDTLLGHVPNDWDVATSATPDQTRQLFAGQCTNMVGESFGVVVVRGVEVAMFRGETYRIPGKPEVNTVNDFVADAARRDFTINAMGMTLSGEIVDPVGGQDDLRNKIIRAVGCPESRFREDPARLLRAATFAARFNFTIEPKTSIAIKKLGYLVRDLPRERVAKELLKVIKAGCLTSWLRHLQDLNLLPWAFPELAHLPGLEQNPRYHNRDVWEHTLAVVDAVTGQGVALELAALFHDSAKGLNRTFKNGQPQDIGHEKAGAKIAHKAIMDLALGKELAITVASLVRHHGHRPALARRSILRMLRKIKDDCQDRAEMRTRLRQLIVLMNADAQAMAPHFSKQRTAEIQQIMQIVKSDKLLELPFFTNELPVNGHDLLQQGFRGPEIGRRLNELLLQAQAVVD